MSPLFESYVRTNKTVHKSRVASIKKELAQRIINTKFANIGVEPEMDKFHYCKTCGNQGLSHPVTSYCFICDTDNWEQNKKAW